MAMDKGKAIELLKEALGEIPHLRELHHERNKQEFELWFNKVQTIIKATLDADDLRKFSSRRSAHVRGWFQDDVYQQDYLKRLTDYETALKSIIQKYELLGFEKEREAIVELPVDATELHIYLFDNMRLHPKIIDASEALFKNRHYAQAIFEAFKAVNNFVKEKTGLTLDGKALMTKVFDETSPIIKLNELLTQSDKDEQEGFRFLFMGAMVGIRNPKAHDNVTQTDPFRTLEHLSFASLLIKRAEEGTLVKTSPPRKRWNLHKFLNDIKNRCSQEEANVTKELYDFTKENADSIYWGTGAETGSFTFHKTKPTEIISIMSVYSDGLIYLNFGNMQDKGVRKDILESFRDKLNKIPSVKIPQDVVTSNKFPCIRAEILAEEPNLEVFKQTILELCQQLDE